MTIQEAGWKNRQDLVDLAFREYVHADILKPTKNGSKKPQTGKLVLWLFAVSIIAGVLALIPSSSFWTAAYLAFGFGLCAIFGTSLAIAQFVVRSRRRYLAFWILAIAIFFFVGWFAP